MEGYNARARRILVVEDEPALRDLYRRVLADEGFEADIAVNGKIAQDMIEKKKYNLFLIDIRMPVLDGKELYQWLQEKHPQLAKRVIFITGSVIGEDTTTFLNITGRLFLLKPFTPDELVAIIRENLKEVEKWQGNK